jgi:hypothetical protein
MNDMGELLKESMLSALRFPFSAFRSPFSALLSPFSALRSHLYLFLIIPFFILLRNSGVTPMYEATCFCGSI